MSGEISCSTSKLVFASTSIPVGLASTLIVEACAGDSRIVCTGATVSLAGSPDPLLEEAEFVVFDLETTGLSAQTSRICELGAVRVRALELVDCFHSLVDPGVPLPQTVARLTGLNERQLRGAPRVGTVVGGFLTFAGDAPRLAYVNTRGNAHGDDALAKLSSTSAARWAVLADDGSSAAAVRAGRDHPEHPAEPLLRDASLPASARARASPR